VEARGTSVSRSSGGNHGYRADESVVGINNSSLSAVGLCENEPNLKAIFSVGILSDVLKKPQGVGVRTYVFTSDVDALPKLLCLHGLQCPMFSLYACRQALLHHLLMGECASAFECVSGDRTACLEISEGTCVCIRVRR
jgi:hypothetical protein